MSTTNDAFLGVLKEIRDTLSRIYTCFEDQYLEIQKQKAEKELAALEEMLTSARRRIYPLLFDHRRLSQTKIADEVGITQSAVSKFISALLAQDLIDRVEDEDSNVTYRDKYDLAELLMLEQETDND